MPRTKKEAQDVRAPARAPRTSARTKRTARPEAASQDQLAVESTLAAAAAALRSPTEEALNSCAAPELSNSTEAESCTCGCGCGCHSAGTKDDECLLPSDDVEILSAFFKALSDPSRLNIVCVLLKYQVTRDGVKNYYALCDSHVAQVIETAIEHINE